MKFGKIILTAIVAVCASSAAMAQDWNGFYIGVNAGHAWAKSDVTMATVFSPTGYFATTSPPAINADGTGRVKPSGFTGGVTLGYNWQWGHGFFGLEGDYNHFNQNDSRTAGHTYPCCAPTAYTVYQNVDVSNLATFRMRAGWANAHWMIYGTAGGAHTKINYNETFTDTFATAYESSWQNATKGGFVWGVGAEAQWAKHWSIKGEWLHSHFSSMSGAGGTLTAFTPAISFPTNTWTHSANLSVDVARVGLNYRF
jgi:outer membrane immunogenic protein